MAAAPQGQRKALPSSLPVGAFLLVVAIIIPAYSIPRLITTPLTMGKNNSGIVKESKEFRAPPSTRAPICGSSPASRTRTGPNVRAV